jgi:hypothetical protein
MKTGDSEFTALKEAELEKMKEEVERLKEESERVHEEADESMKKELSEL